MVVVYDGSHRDTTVGLSYQAISGQSRRLTSALSNNDARRLDGSLSLASRTWKTAHGVGGVLSSVMMGGTLK